MADTVAVLTEMHVEAWGTPDTVRFVGEPFDEGNDTALEIELENAPREVVDALAWQWLRHLYARLQVEPPFKPESDA